MVVDAVKFVKWKGPSRVTCTWFDPTSGCTQNASFLETELKFYDWYNPPAEHIRQPGRGKPVHLNAKRGKHHGE